MAHVLRYTASVYFGHICMHIVLPKHSKNKEASHFSSFHYSSSKLFADVAMALSIHGTVEATCYLHVRKIAKQAKIRPDQAMYDLSYDSQKANNESFAHSPVSSPESFGPVS